MDKELAVYLQIIVNVDHHVSRLGIVTQLNNDASIVQGLIEDSSIQQVNCCTRLKQSVNVG